MHYYENLEPLDSGIDYLSLDLFTPNIPRKRKFQDAETDHFDENFEDKLLQKRIKMVKLIECRKRRQESQDDCCEPKRFCVADKPANVISIESCSQHQRVGLTLPVTSILNRDHDEKMHEDFSELTMLEVKMEIIDCIQENKRHKKILSLKNRKCRHEPKEAPETKRRGVDQMYPWPVLLCPKIRATIDEICIRLHFFQLNDK